MSVFCLVNTAVAAPDTIISKYYYRTAAKQELIGYWYQSCYLSFSVSWGKKEGYVQNDPAMHGWDCTRLGMSGNRRGSCLASDFDGVKELVSRWNSDTKRYEIVEIVDATHWDSITGRCEQENPLF
ncbi:hypothetical protein J1N51_11975 [Psychrosphaera ytuae]|uniref:Uncharacterized protein n=1 Tax=Psychrosphaera ytuae TaxID=2820710 RepID=A0A975DAA2_9GAMM|nr:hypothetical protein [Psychrosphaera ytuae]QTH63442.1 hypothetical protein J1N51_11975 [Psychrosphaera ytuae]